MSAGARARGVPTAGQVFEADEDFLGAPAGAVFERATGRRRRPTGLLALGVPRPRRAQRRTSTTAPRSAPSARRSTTPACPRAAIANADGGGFVPEATVPPHRGRRAGRRHRASCPTARCRRRCSRPAPTAPFGVRLSPAAVVAGLRGGVVARRGGAGGGVGPGRAPIATPRATAGERRAGPARRRCASTDALVGELLDVGRSGARLGARRGARTTAAARCTSPWPACGRPDVEPGLLRSGSTRRTGIVTLVDIAPDDPRPGRRRAPELDGGPALRAGRRRRVHR